MYETSSYTERFTGSFLSLASLVGATGLDAVILFITSIFAYPPSKKTAFNLAVALIVLVVLNAATTIFNKNYFIPESNVKIRLIQPSFQYEQLGRSAWNLQLRRERESVLDSLTFSDIENFDGLVVWPEGGVGLFEKRLKRRRTHIVSELGNSRASLLISGKDLSPDGKKSNSVFLVQNGQYVSQANKYKTVPFSEDGILAGKPTVLQTLFGSVGIAICFDAIFEAHMKKLALNGASYFVVTTNDSSFGETSMPTIHAAYAVLRGIENMRAVAFVSNSGISFVTNQYGEIQSIDWSGKNVGYLEAVIPSLRAKALYTSGGQYVPYFFSMLFIFFALWRIKRQGYKSVNPTRCSPAFLIVGALLLVLCSVTQVLLYAIKNRQSVDIVLDSISHRAKSRKISDHLSLIYKQTSQRSCGAAATAFLLTLLGDEVFEENILDVSAMDSPNGYSMLALQRYINGRGFDAEGFNLALEDLPDMGDVPVIAHMTAGHYLVVLGVAGVTVSLFDPAVGSVLTVDKDIFSTEWSGKILRVRTL